MNIKFLKAGKGDSILIQEGSHNILVDGGDNTTYIKQELFEIYKNKQNLDLLVITHHDDDHIVGVIDIIEDVIAGKFGEGKDFVKQVIFNSPGLIRSSGNNGELSYRKANTLGDLLDKINTKWKHEDIIVSGDKKEFDELKLEILAPNKEILEKYAEEDKGALLSGGRKCDWETPLNVLKKWVDDKNLDTSLSNRSSIVIKLNYQKTNILLTGDVTPKEFYNILYKLSEENDNVPVLFDYIKIPHHGSYRNMSQEIISLIDCQNYIITTNGDFSLPDKKMLLKILLNQNRDFSKKVTFYFNYGELIPSLNITKEELEKYNFDLVPNNLACGYGVNR